MGYEHTQLPQFNVRPKPRNEKTTVLSGDWRPRVVLRGWVTPHYLNILGVLYSSVYMGSMQDAKSVASGAFSTVGLSVSLDDLQVLIDRGWVTRQAAKPPRYKLTAAGSRSYDLLYWAEQEGEFPLKGPVPLSPDEILERRRLGVVESENGPTHRASDVEALRHQEVLRAIEDVRRRQDNLVKVIELALARLDREAVQAAEQQPLDPFFTLPRRD